MKDLNCEAIAQAALGGAAKRQGAELLWRCPRHDDRHPSLQVNAKKNAWLCGPCGAGGNPWQLAAFIAGLSPDDKPAVTAWLRERGLLDGNDRGGGGERRIVATYDYRDESGELLFQTVRYQPKDFRQRRADGKGGWIWNLDAVRVVPYRLPEWREKTTVYIVEGEKDADGLWRLGLPATCNPMGAGKWHDEYNRHFQGKRVVIFPDNDPPGEAHGRHVARELLAVASAVKIVRLPGLPDKGDVSDWIAAGGTREKLGELVKATPVVTAADLADAADQEARELVGVLASEIKPEPVRWLWTNRIPLSKVTVLDGDPGLGKSLLGLEIAARVSRGEPLPGDEAGLSGGAVILSAEDGLADTIRPRLEAAGADLNRVVIVRYAPEKEGERTVSQVPRDIPRVEEAIARVGAKVVVIDVLLAYLGSEVNSYRDQDIRLALAPLASSATRCQVAVLVIRHLNKTPGGNPLYRGGGSIGVIGAARAGMLMAADPENPDVRLLAVTKNNLGRPAPTLACRIEDRAGVPRIAWQGESHHTAATLLATVSGEEGGALADARDFLLAELNAGPKAARDIERAAEHAGIARRTLWRARKALGVVATKAGFSGGWFWALPEKSAKSSEGCQVPKLAAFGENTASSEATKAEDSKTCPKAAKSAVNEDCQVAMAAFGMPGDNGGELLI